MNRSPQVLVAMLVGVFLAVGVALPTEAALPLRTKKCGDVVMSSFRLRNNLVDCAEGLIAGAPGIIIDLNGRTVRGRADSAGARVAGSRNAGIIIGALRGVVVRNGTVRDFGTGVSVVASNRITVRNLLVSGNNATGIDIDAGNRHLIIDNQIVGNGGEGISVRDSNDTEIRDNRVVNSVSTGIFIVGYDDRIIGNTVRRNDGGILAAGGEGYLASNVAENNRGDGIRVDGELYQVVLGRALENEGDGYSFVGTSNTITRARAKFNGQHGISGEGETNVVTRNTVCQNTLRPQIDVDGQANTVRDNDVSARC
jgi:parallel beta-helix repeat protein